MNTEEKSPHYQNVEQLMINAGQEVPNKPTIPSLEIRILRAKLIWEESLETIRALGVEVSYFDDEADHTTYITDILNSQLEFKQNSVPNLQEIIDGCCDIKVVTTGCLISCGIKDIKPQEMVDINNLDKFGPGGYRREDGKWIKPEGHKPPDWKSEIERQEKL